MITRVSGSMQRGLHLGVEEFGEAGVVGHILEVGVGAGLDAVFCVEADGLSEVFEAGVGFAGHAGEDGETIEGVVGLIVLGEDFLVMGARVLVVAFVQQGDGVVVDRKSTRLNSSHLGISYA